MSRRRDGNRIGNGSVPPRRERGRIERILFILSWLQSVELRRRVHASLNKGEARTRSPGQTSSAVLERSGTAASSSSAIAQAALPSSKPPSRSGTSFTSREGYKPQLKSGFRLADYFGVVRDLRAALPLLRKQGSGRRLGVSNSLGIMPVPLIGYYSATKAAVEALHETMARRSRVSASSSRLSSLIPMQLNSENLHPRNGVGRMHRHPSVGDGRACEPGLRQA